MPWSNSFAHLNGFTCHSPCPFFDRLLKLSRQSQIADIHIHIHIHILISGNSILLCATKMLQIIALTNNRKRKGSRGWRTTESWKNFWLLNAYFKCQVLNCGRRVCKNVWKLLQLLPFAICYFSCALLQAIIKTSQESGVQFGQLEKQTTRQQDGRQHSVGGRQQSTVGTFREAAQQRTK